MTDRRKRLLFENEKWGRAMRDEWHGLIRPRIACQVGGRDNPFLCGRWALWLVGRKKLCAKHAGRGGVR